VYLNQALRLVKSLSEPTATANLLNSIGVLYLEQEDYSQSKKAFNEALQVYRSTKNQREAARLLLNLGVVEQRKYNYQEALSQFKLSLDTATATESKDVAIAAGEGIGVVLTAKKDFAKALEAFNESLGIAKEIKDRTRQTELLWRSAETFFAMGDYAQSVSLRENAVDLARAAHLPKLSYLAMTSLGQGYAAQKKQELATETLKKAVEQLEMMRDQVAGTEIESQLFLENKLA